MCENNFIITSTSLYIFEEANVLYGKEFWRLLAKFHYCPGGTQNKEFTETRYNVEL